MCWKKVFPNLAQVRLNAVGEPSISASSSAPVTALKDPAQMRRTCACSNLLYTIYLGVSYHILFSGAVCRTSVLTSLFGGIHVATMEHNLVTRKRERERETESGVTLAHCTCSLSHFTMPHLAQDFKTGVNISKCRLFACKQLVAVSP